MKLASLFQDSVTHHYVLSIDLLAFDGLYHTRALLYAGARTAMNATALSACHPRMPKDLSLRQRNAVECIARS